MQAELYAARRYRIVAVDPDRLMKDDDCTITLFDDTAPLHLTADSIQGREDGIAWNARVLVDLPEVLRSRGARQTALLSAVAWDTDQAGRALLSFDNRNERQSLKRHVFHSVSADFQMLFPRAAYRLVPLKYTPKYHVLFELDPERIVPILVDRVVGEAVERTPPIKRSCRATRASSAVCRLIVTSPWWNYREARTACKCGSS